MAHIVNAQVGKRGHNTLSERQLHVGLLDAVDLARLNVANLIPTIPNLHHTNNRSDKYIGKLALQIGYGQLGQSAEDAGRRHRAFLVLIPNGMPAKQRAVCRIGGIYLFIKTKHLVKAHIVGRNIGSSVNNVAENVV